MKTSFIELNCSECEMLNAALCAEVDSMRDELKHSLCDDDVDRIVTDMISVVSLQSKICDFLRSRFYENNCSEMS